MKTMRNLLFTMLIFFSLNANSQGKEKFIYLNVSDKTVSLFPFYKIFGSNFDPSISIGAGKEYVQHNNSTIFQTFQGTWYSHNLIGGGITLSTSLGYRYTLPADLFVETKLGISGTSYISARETFVLNENGEYINSTPVHWSIGVPIDLGFGYAFANMAIYCNYTYMLEGKYTDILPILPTSLISVGFRYQLKEKTAK